LVLQFEADQFIREVLDSLNLEPNRLFDFRLHKSTCDSLIQTDVNHVFRPKSTASGFASPNSAAAGYLEFIGAAEFLWLHGGLSTGPKTAEGIERIRRAQLKHGRYTKRAKAERAEYRELLRACRDMLAGL
jgi:hypothetical protein